MKKLFAAFFCLVLAGCTDADWDHALNYAHLGGSPSEDIDAPAAPQPRAVSQTAAATAAAPAPVAPAPAAPENSDLCRAVATQDATENGFDLATQRRVFAQSYAQCVTIYTR